MRFFSRFVFICNICFIISVILRLVEISKRLKGNLEPAIPFQPLQATLVILGYGAIFFNIVFLICLAYYRLTKKMILIHRRVIVFNMIMLPVQVYYFLFSNF